MANHVADRASTPSPSRCDQRRQKLVDRIAALEEKMGHDGRDQLLREQLQRIQVDTNLVMAIDPYSDRPLDAFEEDEQRYIQFMKDGQSALETAGPRFQDWIQEVQDLVEGRDSALAKCKVEYDRKCGQYQNEYAFRVETAKREHDALCKTLRDRLLNKLNAKKKRLSRQKDAFEMSNVSSALLLHANQFGITDPSSPGGKRSTRNRHNGGGHHDEGSPAPQRRRALGDVFSFDELFTDKEVRMTYNTAAVSAHRHLLTHKPRVDGNGHVSDMDELELTSELLSAPPMERNVSHGTRSARGKGNQTGGMDVLATYDMPPSLWHVGTDADPMTPSGVNRNVPAPFAADVVDHDLALMGLYKNYDAQHGQGANFDHDFGARKMLEAAAEPVGYVARPYLQGTRPSELEVRNRLGLPAVARRQKQQQQQQQSGAAALGAGAGAGAGAGPASASISRSRQSSTSTSTSTSTGTSSSGMPMSRGSSRQKTRAARGV